MRAGLWLPALMVGCVLGSAGLAEADKLYKWTDGDGNVHYTDHPPPAEAKKITSDFAKSNPGTIVFSKILETKNF